MPPRNQEASQCNIYVKKHCPDGNLMEEELQQILKRDDGSKKNNCLHAKIQWKHQRDKSVPL
jgi:hypothetical protein